MNTEAEAANEQIPGRLQNNFGDWDNSDIWFTVSCAALGVIVWQRVDFLMVALVLLVWFFLMWRSHSGGRRYYLVGAFVRSTWRARIRKGETSRTIKKQADPTIANRVGRRRGDGGSSPDIPFAVTSVPSNNGDGTIGILHVKRAHTDSFVVVSEGADISSTPLVSQHNSYMLMGDMVAKLVSAHQGYSVGVSYEFRKDPFDSSELAVKLDEFLRPEIIHPHGATVPDDELHTLTDAQSRELFVGGVWAQLQGEMIPIYGRKVWMATIVTIRRDGVLAKAESNKTIDERHIKRLPINRMVNTVIGALKAAGVTNPRALDKGEMHGFVRGAWDTVNIEEYYDLVARDPEAPYKDGFNEHWPRKEMKAFGNYSVTDGNYATSLRIKSNPEEVTQVFWASFFTSIPTPYFACTLVGSAVRSSGEIWLLERATALLSAFGDLIGVDYKTLSMRRREEKLEKRKVDIFDTQFSQSYNIFVTLRTDGEEALNHVVEDTNSLASEYGISTQRIGLAVQQYPALWSGTLGIGGLL